MHTHPRQMSICKYPNATEVFNLQNVFHVINSTSFNSIFSKLKVTIVIDTRKERFYWEI